MPIKWNVPSKSDLGNTLWIGAKHPGMVAMRAVQAAFAPYEVRGMLTLRPSIDRCVRRGAPDGLVIDGEAIVEGRIRLSSGHDVRFEVPVPIRKGRARIPSILSLDGQPHVISQQTFDDIKDAYMIMAAVRDRPSLFSPPPDSPQRVRRQEVIRPGMFHIPAASKKAQETGAGGWPLVPSKTFPGEKTLACPRCLSTDVMMTVDYGARGTGPGGRGRLGDPGSSDVNICQSCGLRSNGEDAKKDEPIPGPTDDLDAPV